MTSYCHPLPVPEPSGPQDIVGFTRPGGRRAPRDRNHRAMVWDWVKTYGDMPMYIPPPPSVCQATIREVCCAGPGRLPDILIERAIARRNL